MSLPGIRKICAVLMAVLLGFAFQTVVFAAPLGGTCSITLDAHYHEDDGTTRYLAGDTYALTLIADKTVDAATLDVTYTVVDAYRAYDCDWDAATASDRLALAKKLAKVAVPEKTGVTDHNGKLTFGGLKPGLYLVVRCDAAEETRHISLTLTSSHCRALRTVLYTITSKWTRSSLRWTLHRRNRALNRQSDRLQKNLRNRLHNHLRLTSCSKPDS